MDNPGGNYPLTVRNGGNKPVLVRHPKGQHPVIRTHVSLQQDIHKLDFYPSPTGFTNSYYGPVSEEP